MNERALAELDAEPLDWRWKGIPQADDGLTVGQIADQKWNLLDGDLLMPVMVLKGSVLDSNIAALAEFCGRYGMEFAPHGKTYMAPQIFKRQLDAGAWGITASTMSHVRIYRNFGVERILMAYQPVEPAAIRWVAGELDRDPAFEFLCLVDSERQVQIMNDTLDEVRPSRPLQVLVELGYPGGRTGCRSIEEAEALAALVGRSPRLELAGTEGYEGLMPFVPGAEIETTIPKVERYLDEYRAFHERLDRAGAFDGLEHAVVTSGGSAMFDKVAERLTGWDTRVPVRTIVRSGGYATHDSLMFVPVSPLDGRRPPQEPLRLHPAMELWGAVLSRPEPDLAILSLGRRDAPYDAGLPLAQSVTAAGSRALRDVRGAYQVTGLNDQHAFMRVPPDDALAVGELVGFGVSHPCSMFDKWRLVFEVDDDYTVVGGIRTFF
jgi:D-serine deaminase-like pyridoxal phosphate-dependent protein